MFEDVAKNLAVPKARGMTTTLVTVGPGQADDREPHDHATSESAAAVADFVTDNLGAFLAKMSGQVGTCRA